ncbi:hypothetical protein ACHAXA_009162 [Cyclostephanos tholiformis]|uniref:Uncharacterized protein n=1 Tax=Cyclostephanos tholiformis TaxID=382380 RepID=A0ABD3RR47_9STRA
MASSMAWMNLVIASLLSLHFILVRATIVRDDIIDEPSSAAVYDHLPKSSSDILARHTCGGEDVMILLGNFVNNKNEIDDPFYRWVISARHTTWNPPGWEVALPRWINRTTARDHVTTSAADGEEDGVGYYARVFDLLDSAREGNLLPVPIDVASICHKGMKSPNNARTDHDDDDDAGGGSTLPPGHRWRGHDACIEQLRSTARVSSSCIDIPGIVVANPNPPMKVNNPCHLPYRMVDGAHRMCLRKYLLHVATAELVDLEGTTVDVPIDDHGELPRRRRHLRDVIDGARYGPFFVLDQATFEAALTNVDPKSTWAKDKHRLMHAVTGDLRLEWQAWMGRVMDRVWEGDDDAVSKWDCSSVADGAESCQHRHT